MLLGPPFGLWGVPYTQTPPRPTLWRVPYTQTPEAVPRGDVVEDDLLGDRVQRRQLVGRRRVQPEPVSGRGIAGSGHGYNSLLQPAGGSA